MSLVNRTLRPAGTLTITHIHAPKAPLAWRLKNTLRRSFLKGWIAFHLIRPFARAWGVMTAMGVLEATLIKADGTRIHYGVLSYRVITDAGVAYMVDDFDGGANDINLLDFHGCGIDDTPGEAVGDVALQSESTTILNPDSTRASGVNTQPSANIFRTTGTVLFDGGGAIVEHGIFNQAATGGGTLWDRSTFAAINVIAGDSIAFQYSLTLTSGG